VATPWWNGSKVSAEAMWAGSRFHWFIVFRKKLVDVVLVDVYGEKNRLLHIQSNEINLTGSKFTAEGDYFREVHVQADKGGRLVKYHF
jgi:hypothetical protein